MISKWNFIVTGNGFVYGLLNEKPKLYIKNKPLTTIYITFGFLGFFFSKSFTSLCLESWVSCLNDFEYNIVKMV